MAISPMQMRCETVALGCHPLRIGAWNIGPGGTSVSDEPDKRKYPWSMFRCSLMTAVVSLALVFSSTAILPAAATTNETVGTHKLIVAVEKTLGPAAERKLAVLVLISQNGGAPAGALVTPSKPLTVLQSNSGLYRVKAEIDSPCKGGCDASYRIFGSANHKLEVIPSCQLKGSGFVCSKVKIVKVY
jgi:hypothetical protein